MNTVEPIRDLTQIEAMKEILKSNSIRDYLLFVMGINTGLRISDLLALKQGDSVKTILLPYNTDGG
jgi:integrase